MKSEPMKEPQYEEMRKAEQSFGRATLGLSTNQAYLQDPKTLVFRSARYKFVAHMLRGKRRVLEVGCGDAFMSRIVQQEVGDLIAVDFDRDLEGAVIAVVPRMGPLRGTPEAL